MRYIQGKRKHFLSPLTTCIHVIYPSNIFFTEPRVISKLFSCPRWKNIILLSCPVFFSRSQIFNASTRCHYPAIGIQQSCSSSTFPIYLPFTFSLFTHFFLRFSQLSFSPSLHLIYFLHEFWILIHYNMIVVSKTDDKVYRKNTTKNRIYDQLNRYTYSVCNTTGYRSFKRTYTYI